MESPITNHDSHTPNSPKHKQKSKTTKSPKHQVKDSEAEDTNDVNGKEQDNLGFVTDPEDVDLSVTPSHDPEDSRLTSHPADTHSDTRDTHSTEAQDDNTEHTDTQTTQQHDNHTEPTDQAGAQNQAANPSQQVPAKPGLGRFSPKRQTMPSSELGRTEMLALSRFTSGVNRTQSMRTVVNTKTRMGKLLRDLSFSDSDGDTIHKFGGLKTALTLPRREADSQENKGEHDPDSLISVQASRHMTSLMSELLSRGKVIQLAVIHQESNQVLTSLPTWLLTKADIVGLVKTVTSSCQAMAKLNIHGEIYTCFKHDRNKMAARAGDNMLVAQATTTCVVVGRSLEDKPGSSLCEIETFAKALIDRGW